jgi:flagellar hook protein FlgE
MALIGSLSSGVSAMQSFVKGMEIIGDNIANSKTVGYKKQRASFTDNFSQTLRDATPGNAGASNLPAIQIGSGVSLAGTQKLFDQGAIELTGVASDLAISGSGFFRVFDAINETQYLTRDGSFRVDELGFLTDKAGNFLLGATGGTATAAPGVLNRLQISLDTPAVRQNAAGQPIDIVNRLVLSDGTRALSNGNSSTGFYRTDGEGRLLDTVNLSSLKAIILANPVGAEANARAALHNDGNYYLINDAGNYIDLTGAEIVDGVPASVAFNPAGAIPATPAFSANATRWDLQTQPFASVGMAVAADAEWDDTAPVPAVAVADESDPNQFLLAIQNWTINKEGELRLALNDGSSFIRANVLLQNVQDPDALTAVGGGLFTGVENAGAIGMEQWAVGSVLTSDQLANHIPNQGGRGFIQSRALEGSNTDLTQEFSEMITTQRAFQAGSKVITVSDEMLQEIINLKR